jgi:hypothetical protein
VESDLRGGGGAREGDSLHTAFACVAGGKGVDWGWGEEACLAV